MSPCLFAVFAPSDAQKGFRGKIPIEDVYKRQVLMQALLIAGGLLVVVSTLCVAFANPILRLAGSQPDTHGPAVTLSLIHILEPILQSGDDLQISAGDCLSFREYLEMEEKTNGLLRQEAYKQGWRDSARLLCLLG